MLRQCACLPLFLVLALPCFGQSSEPDAWVRCNSLSSVPLYAERNEISTKLEDLQCEDAITVVSWAENWAQVRTKSGKTGYVLLTNIQLGMDVPLKIVRTTITTTSTVILWAKVEAVPGLQAECPMYKHILRKMQSLSAATLEARYKALTREVTKLQNSYRKELDKGKGVAAALETRIFERKMELFTVLYARRHSHSGVTPEETDSMLSFGLSPPRLCGDFSLDLSRLRSSPQALQELLNRYEARTSGLPAPQIVVYEGMVLGLLEADPVQATLEAEPGGQAVVFKRKFQPARQVPAGQKELPQTKMVYELSMNSSPNQIPNADISVNIYDQVIFQNGQPTNPEWIWEFKPHQGFTKATITLNAQLRAYEDENSRLAHKALGSPDTIVVPLATFDMRKPAPKPSRTSQVATFTWHLLVDLFGLIGAIPTLLLLWPRRRWIGRKLKAVFRWIAEVITTVWLKISRGLLKKPT